MYNSPRPNNQSQPRPTHSQPPQAAADGWRPWSTPEKAPRPDLEDYRLKKCFQCSSTRMTIVENAQSNGVMQFKGSCQDCGTKTGALPYAKDLDSIGCTVIPFGKYKGMTLMQIHQEAPDYLQWCADNLTDVKLLGTVILFGRLLGPVQPGQK